MLTRMDPSACGLGMTRCAFHSLRHFSRFLWNWPAFMIMGK